MNLVAFLLLAAFSGPSAAPEVAGADEKPKKERMICKRIDASESRMASKRICKTAKEWKGVQSDGSDDSGLAMDAGTRGN